MLYTAQSVYTAHIVDVVHAVHMVHIVHMVHASNIVHTLHNVYSVLSYRPYRTSVQTYQGSWKVPGRHDNALFILLLITSSTSDGW